MALLKFASTSIFCKEACDSPPFLHISWIFSGTWMSLRAHDGEEQVGKEVWVGKSTCLKRTQTQSENWLKLIRSRNPWVFFLHNRSNRFLVASSERAWVPSAMSGFSFSSSAGLLSWSIFKLFNSLSSWSIWSRRFMFSWINFRFSRVSASSAFPSGALPVPGASPTLPSVCSGACQAGQVVAAWGDWLEGICVVCVHAKF